jgi:pimeloyl-ACP methyl ester carboxylesterase
MNASGTSLRDRALPAITRLIAVDLGPCVHVFANYGHNPFWEDPNAVAAVVNPFLSERP